MKIFSFCHQEHAAKDKCNALRDLVPFVQF